MLAVDVMESCLSRAYHEHYAFRPRTRKRVSGIITLPHLCMSPSHKQEQTIHYRTWVRVFRRRDLLYDAEWGSMDRNALVPMVLCQHGGLI